LSQVNPSAPDQQAPDSGAGEASRVDIRLYLAIIRRRFWVLLSVVAVAIGLAIFLTSRMPYKYRAAATIVIDLQPAQILNEVKGFDNESAGWWQGTTYLKTQEEILNSGRLALLAAERMRPDDRLRLLGRPKHATLGEEDVQRAASAIQGAREVKPGKDSRKFTISAVHTDKELAAAIANAMVDAYANYNLAQRQDSSKVAEDWLSERLDQLEDKLKESEQKLQDFRRTNNLLTTSLKDQLNGVSNRIMELQKKINDLSVKRIELSSDYEQIKKLKNVDPTSDPSTLMVKNPVLDGLRQAYAVQYQKLVELRGDYLEKHPKIQAQEGILSQIRTDIQREAGLAMRVLDAQLKAIISSEGQVQAALKVTEKQGMDLGEKAMQYTQLERVAKQTAKYYDLVLSRYTESGLAKKLKTNNVQVLDRAKVPMAPFSPRLHVNLAIAFALGLVLGLGLIFLLHFMDNTVKAQEDIEHLVGLPFLGILPSIQLGRKRRWSRKHSQPAETVKDGVPATVDLYQWNNPKSELAEHCRSIRTSLLFMSPDKPLKAIVVSSSMPQEGKTTVAINIAISMAMSGERVLLVDTDMRRPRVHKAFGLTAKRGISAVLVNEAKLDEVTQKSPVDNLFVLPCGSTPPNPAELLHTKRFREIVEELKGKYDRVIFDSPPVGAVTDPVILSKAVDGAILVAKTGVTIRAMLAKTARVFSDVKANVLGCVLNDLDPNRRTYGGYYHYYYYRKRGYYQYYGDSKSE
jgi:capsular exopolysaccharide synthesis family protein